jgi:hypothetical protein
MAVVEQTESEKQKARWTDEYKKNEAGTTFDNFAYLNAQLNEINSKIDAMNPQATLQRQVMMIAGAVTDMNRRLAELEKVKKA